MTAERKQYLLVGEVIKPHGIRGELGIRSHTEYPEQRFANGASLLFGPDENSLVPAEVERGRQFKKGYLLKLDTVGDRNRAEEVRGWGLYIEAGEASPLDEDSYYHHQLIGLRVRDKTQGELGTVAAIVETPAQELLEIERAGDDSFYIPLVGEFVLDVDTEAGVIETDLPRELTEL